MQILVLHTAYWTTRGTSRFFSSNFLLESEWVLLFPSQVIRTQRGNIFKAQAVTVISFQCGSQMTICGRTQYPVSFMKVRLPGRLFTNHFPPCCKGHAVSCLITTQSWHAMETEVENPPIRASFLRILDRENGRCGCHNKLRERCLYSSLFCPTAIFPSVFPSR